MSYVYFTDQELPSLAVNWTDGATGATIDLSSGYTFSVKIANRDTPGTILLTKTSGITGAATNPNVVVDWSTTDWSGLTSSVSGVGYIVWLYARRTGDTKDRVFNPGIGIPLTLKTAPV